MPLRSQLFSGDQRLEDCLIHDQAHLTLGTVGPFVRKVQRAVAAITGISASIEDVTASRYGQSTADAVLKYKQSRNIINYNYQTTADNVVGKMTIRHLDDEMVRMEALIHTPSCGDPVGGFAAPSAGEVARPAVRLGFAVGDTPFRLPSLLRMTWQISTLGERASGRRLAAQVQACNNILPSDLMITVVGADLTVVKPFVFNEIVQVLSELDIAGLVRAADKAKPSRPGELRVIVHPLVDAKETFGITKHGPYDGEFLGTTLILNATLQRNDNLTLLHEMVHAATHVSIHDCEPGGVFDQTSVFSINEGRDHIRPEHAAKLRLMPWCMAWPDQF